MKRVYFAGSIRGGREDLALYAALIARLSALQGVYHVAYLAAKEE